MNNPNCDGSGPCNQTLQTVRVLPTGGDGNAILCMSCFAREMIFRRERNRELPTDCQFALPAWESLKVYAKQEAPPDPETRVSVKRYACKRCGHETEQSTNHYGETYGIGSYNECPKCPPFRRPTVWVCKEEKPAGAWTPEPWKIAAVALKT